MPGPPSDFSPYQIHNGLAIYRFGIGSPIFFMPGPHRFQRPGHRTADALIDGFVQLGHQVITFDPPGSGYSTRPAQISMAEMHQCTEEALEVCQISDQVGGVGHSMGGLALLAYAIDYPARFNRLALVGAGTGRQAYMNAPEALWNRSHPAFWRTAVLGILHMVWPCLAPEKINLNFIEYHSFQNKSLVRPKRVEPRDWLRPKEGRGTEWHRVAKNLDYASYLHKIKVPTLILCGRYDPQYPPACSEELARGIPNSRLQFFEHSGHYPFIEEAKEFWMVVQSFWK